MTPTFADGAQAMKALQTFVQAELSGAHAATFADYGGAACVIEENEDDVGGLPYIILSLESDEGSQYSTGARPRNDCVINAQTVVADDTGLQVGAHTPIAADTLLKRALTNIIESNYSALNQAGFLLISIRTLRKTIEDSDQGELHKNPQPISFTYNKS